MYDHWDVIVAGGGTAGMSTAILAAQRGARVLVIEHAQRLGGTLHMCSGRLSAAGTRLQAQRGIHDTPQLHFQDVMRISHRTADQRAVKKVVEHGAETFHWLLDNDFKVLPDSACLHCGVEPYSIPRMYFARDRGTGIFNALLPLYRAQERAGKIGTLLGVEVTAVVRQPDGAVSGVRLEDDSDATGEMFGDNVVLATGGYARHAERFASWTGKKLYSGANHYSRGTGHQIGLDAGGVLKHGDKFLCTFAGVRNPADPASFDIMTALVPQRRPPWEVYVNYDGRRFMREEEPSARARARALHEQPEMSFWAIYDSRMLAQAPQPFIFALTPEQLEPLWNEHPSFIRAGTIEQLSRRGGMDPAAVLRTLDLYNCAVRSGIDVAFDRKHMPVGIGVPPYYAVLHHGTSVVSWAGLETDDHFRVLNQEHRPIPNLYAVGEVLGFGLTNGEAIVGGMGLQPALTFGRLLGQRVLHW